MAHHAYIGVATRISGRSSLIVFIYYNLYNVRIGNDTSETDVILLRLQDESAYNIIIIIIKVTASLT